MTLSNCKRKKKNFQKQGYYLIICNAFIIYKTFFIKKLQSKSFHKNISLFSPLKLLIKLNNNKYNNNGEFDGKINDFNFFFN